MGNLVFQATLGGQVNLVGPNTASTFNLNVPAVSSTIATLAAQTFAGTQTFSVDALISGLTVGKGAGAVSTNTAVGASALAANTSGGTNVAVGSSALAANTSGGTNTAIGANALAVATSDDNTAVGGYSLYRNTTGTVNTSIGGSSMAFNTTGSYNVAVGRTALYSNTTGAENTAVGYQAGYSVTTGYGNSFYGRLSGQNTTGYNNTFYGGLSGYLVTSGNNNTILGRFNGNQGGVDGRTASNYILLSDGDGNPRFFTNGPQAWAINSASGYRYSELDFNIANINKASFYWDDTLARFYVGTSSAAMYISNGGTSWTSASDERAKDIIEPIANAVNKVSTLRSVIGKYKNDEAGTRRSFLIAQDVLAVLPEAVAVPDEGATEKDGSPAMMGVEYTAVIPLLVAAIKELKAEIDTLKGQA